jgi:hypothetical protein
MHRQRSISARADEQMRRRVAVEAARLISEHGIRDYAFAKRKAAAHLGVPLDSALPANREVEDALREHQRLFAGDEQPAHLRHLRAVAAEAMQFLADFEPRLVGAVLDGSADRYSAVCLHLFADEAEAIARFLGERHIPFEERDRELRLTREQRRRFPAFVFSAGGTPVDLTVLPLVMLHQAPLDRDGDKPMARASLAALDVLRRADPATDQRPASGT